MGISATQGRFLSERLLCNTDKEAAERIGIAPKTVYQWKLEYPEFATLYDNLANDGVNIALEILRQNLGKAAEVVTDAMQAKDSRGKPDHIARMNAAKMAMQAHGMLKERQVHSGDPENPIIIASADDLHEAVKRAKGEQASGN